MKITVSGVVGEGRSTIARMIRNALEDWGIPVEMVDLPEEGYDETNLRHKAESIGTTLKKQKKEVIIKTRQLRRNHY